jgi:hypothetical protein
MSRVFRSRKAGELKTRLLEIPDCSVVENNSQFARLVSNLFCYRGLSTKGLEKPLIKNSIP